MPSKLVSDNGEHIVIRPLAYVREKDIVKYARGAQVSDHPATSAARSRIYRVPSLAA